MKTAIRNGILRFVIGAVLLLVVVVAGLFSYLRWYPSTGVPLEQLADDCAMYVKRIATDDALLLTNCEVRQWYLDQVDNIAPIDAELQAKGVGTAQRALCAYAVRHQARIEARDKMPVRWDVVKLRWRDLLVYGNPDGPTFVSLLPDDSETSYLNVIQSAQQTNRVVNKACQGDTP